MEYFREITLDADADEVWRLLSDHDELAAWVGDEVRGAAIRTGDGVVSWTWAPDGVASTVELTLATEGERTTVRVVEHRPMATAGARACSIGDAWDDRLFGLELRCLTQRFLATPTL